MTNAVKQVEDLLGIETSLYSVRCFDANRGDYGEGYVTVKEGKFNCDCCYFGNVCIHVDDLKAHLEGERNPRAAIRMIN